METSISRVEELNILEDNKFEVEYVWAIEKFFKEELFKLLRNIVVMMKHFLS